MPTGTIYWIDGRTLETEMMTDGRSQRVWRELPPDVRQEARQLARQGYVHPDNEVVEAALTALRRDYRRYLLLRSLSLWLGSPVLGGIMLAMLYLGGQIDDAPWWWLLPPAVLVGLVAGHQALRERGAVPSPIGSDLPFAMGSAFAERLGREDSVQTRARGRERVFQIGGIAVGALLVAYVLVVLLDRPADLRNGLITAVLWGVLLGGRYLVEQIKKSWRARRNDRS
ncbi:MAG TPA: hypothetical protein VFC19_00125 [Candidatus Limnocylindrales bacterium]|nr:hypothetical protein [Candidatus Limnocylindrales bacterium]